MIANVNECRPLLDRAHQPRKEEEEQGGFAEPVAAQQEARQENEMVRKVRKSFFIIHSQNSLELFQVVNIFYCIGLVFIHEVEPTNPFFGCSLLARKKEEKNTS